MTNDFRQWIKLITILRSKLLAIFIINEIIIYKTMSNSNYGKQLTGYAIKFIDMYLISFVDNTLLNKRMINPMVKVYENFFIYFLDGRDSNRLIRSYNKTGKRMKSFSELKPGRVRLDTFPFFKVTLKEINKGKDIWGISKGLFDISKSISGMDVA